MLFHSSIRKELARSFGATLVVLGTVVMTMMLIRTLGQASRGSVNPSDVMMVLAYTVLGHLPTLLTLSLFIAAVGTLSRMYRDSEMVIWFASGRGLIGLLAPLLRSAWPVLLGIAVLALFVWPWTNQQVQDLKDRFEKRGDIERIAPGQFQESASGTRVFFVDKDALDSRVGNNVFIAATERGKEAMTSARSAKLETIKDDRFLLLGNGQRLERTVGEGTKVSEFVEYGTRVGATGFAAPEEVPARSRSTLELMLSPTPINLGELAWRLGLALAALNFVVIAVTVSSVNPRAGRSGNLLFALFAFVVYYNLLNLGQSWIAGGKFGFFPYLLALHGGIFALGLLWLAKRHNNWSLRAALRPDRSRATNLPKAES
jgi:lipopolysaccharide export system permease protein